MKKLITNLLCTLSILLVIWVGLSYADIIADNTRPGSEHHALNFFTIMNEWRD